MSNAALEDSHSAFNFHKQWQRHDHSGKQVTERQMSALDTHSAGLVTVFRAVCIESST